MHDRFDIIIIRCHLQIVISFLYRFMSLIIILFPHDDKRLACPHFSWHAFTIPGQKLSHAASSHKQEISGRQSVRDSDWFTYLLTGIADFTHTNVAIEARSICHIACDDERNRKEIWHQSNIYTIAAKTKQLTVLNNGMKPSPSFSRKISYYCRQYQILLKYYDDGMLHDMASQ